VESRTQDAEDCEERLVVGNKTDGGGGGGADEKEKEEEERNALGQQREKSGNANYTGKA
jgi:hypothetical protein